MKITIIPILLTCILSISAGVIIYFLLHEKGGVADLMEQKPDEPMFASDHSKRILDQRGAKVFHFETGAIKDGEITEGGWKLIWEDNFQGRWLNPENWNVEEFASEKNN